MTVHSKCGRLLFAVQLPVPVFSSIMLFAFRITRGAANRSEPVRRAVFGHLDDVNLVDLICVISGNENFPLFRNSQKRYSHWERRAAFVPVPTGLKQHGSAPPKAGPPNRQIAKLTFLSDESNWIQFGFSWSCQSNRWKSVSLVLMQQLLSLIRIEESAVQIAASIWTNERSQQVQGANQTQRVWIFESVNKPYRCL